MKYPTYKLGEIIDKVPIEFKVKQKEYLPKGKFPVVDQGQDLIGGFVDDESLLVKTELPVIVFGDHTKAKKFIDFPFVAGADGTKIIKPKKEFYIEPKLFYWFLHCVKFPDKGYARHFQYLLKSDIAVPPPSHPAHHSNPHRNPLCRVGQRRGKTENRTATTKSLSTGRAE